MIGAFPTVFFFLIKNTFLLNLLKRNLILTFHFKIIHLDQPIYL